MNDWERLRRQAQRVKENYPPGTRVMLLSMEDPWAPVHPGTRGTVEVVDDIGQIHMKWDNGRSLALVPGEDSLRRSNVDHRPFYSRRRFRVPALYQRRRPEAALGESVRQL